MVIVDTSVWIDALRGTPTRSVVWLKGAIAMQEIGLVSLVLCEVLQGVRLDSEFLDFQRDLMRFPVFDIGRVDVAVKSAHNYRALRKKGYTVRRTIDCIIATFCIEEDHVLLHNDRDFDAFEQHLGLQVIHP
jgi:predicted nucleic acid-binding protein